MLNNPKLPSRHGRVSHKTQRPQSFTAMMKCVLLALPFTVLLGALLLCICTALLLLTKNPIRYTLAPGILCLYLTAGLGGALSVRLYGKRAPVLCGLTMGILLMLCAAIPALFSPQGTTNAPTALLMRLLIPVASLAGALLAAKKRKTRHRRAQKRTRT